MTSKMLSTRPAVGGPMIHPLVREPVHRREPVASCCERVESGANRSAEP